MHGKMYLSPHCTHQDNTESPPEAPQPAHSINHGSYLDSLPIQTLAQVHDEPLMDKDLMHTNGVIVQWFTISDFEETYHAPLPSHFPHDSVHNLTVWRTWTATQRPEDAIMRHKLTELTTALLPATASAWHARDYTLLLVYIAAREALQDVSAH
jgi:hypothetical protein